MVQASIRCYIFGLPGLVFLLLVCNTDLAAQVKYEQEYRLDGFLYRKSRSSYWVGLRWYLKV